MLVKEIMTRKLDSILPTASLRDAARKMRTLNTGSLPVVENARLIGIITEHDICCHGVADDFDPVLTPVRAIMSRDAAFCFSYDTVNDAVRQMEQRHIQEIAVLNSDKTLAGFLSVDDIAHFSRQLAGELLESAGQVHH
ncbi:MAG TPA: CBS domain-containing protein [Acidiferrobacterales bacterium]|nr:CBS domain-containing protein [Acidiferrobacterales bacterium]